MIHNLTYAPRIRSRNFRHYCRLMKGLRALLFFELLLRRTIKISEGGSGYAT